MSQINPSILIIDDQMESLALLLSYLKDKPIDIQVALSGADGLRKALAGQPDAILLDVAMPGMDGYEVCQRLKSNPRTAIAPVIFLSANVTTNDKLKGFKVGGVDYIAKPFSAEEVLARIYVHIKLHAVTRTETLAKEAERLNTDIEVTRAERILNMALTYLQTHLSEWPGLEKLARLCLSNERTLEELFKKQFAMTVYDYLLELRLEKARSLLAGSSLQIQLIAEQSGYQNPSDFSRAFRRRYGLGPRQYRQTSNFSAGDTLA